MSESPEPNTEQSAEDLASEFHNLGANLKKYFVSAWESEQRKTIQTEIESGLNELGDTLKRTADEIQNSETGQRIKSEATDLRDRVRDGEVEQKVRSDLTKLLQKLNTELEKAIPPEDSPSSDEEDSPKQE